MARHEANREDLMQEATALVPRAELMLSTGDVVVAGIRESRRLSIYFGLDRAYHFDASGRLRRAYVENALYRTQGSTLARLRRSRTADRTWLVRQDLTKDELDGFLRDMKELLEQLAAELSSGVVSVLRQVPPDDCEFVLQVAELLTTAGQGRLAPRIPGK